jgi:hypothetical protein
MAMKKSVVKACVWTAFFVLLLAIVVLPFLGFSAPEGFLDAKRDYGCEYGKTCQEGTFCQKNQCIPLYPKPTGEPEGTE